MTPAEQRAEEVAELYCDKPRCADISRDSKTWNRMKAAGKNGFLTAIKDQPEVLALVIAAEAVQKYDAAIFVSAQNGELELDPLGALAGGHDLDALYMDMKTKTDHALAQWKTFVGEA